jgi:hypothetical protein
VNTPEIVSLAAGGSVTASAAIVAHAIRHHATAIRETGLSAIAAGCKVKAGWMVEITPPPVPKAPRSAAAAVNGSDPAGADALPSHPARPRAAA